MNMKSLPCVLAFSFISILWSRVSPSSVYPSSFALNPNVNVVKTIVVDQWGHGDFRTVQQAVDSIPSGNNEWIKIYIKRGIYNEKVQITKDKQRIVMEGEHQSTTVIQFNDAGNAIDSATFRLFADNFVGINLTFRNTYNLPLPSNDAKKVSVAPAAVVNGDKVMFYSCGFISVQDTLCDGIGRHYFFSCDIEGAVDFIWGRGQSVYMRCRINVAGRLMGGTPGFITAQGRESEQDTSGFVFIMCGIVGNTKAYLGRAYRRYSRVLFSRTIMSDIVVPQGWDAWNYAGQEQTITYAEVNCEGPGANKKGRVKWEKTLPPDEINFLKSPKTFIDADNWMEQLPVSAKLPMY